jgi:uncharacterized protein (DUF2141 family)
MYKHFSPYLVALLSMILLGSCAQINPLTGGEKDVYAPKIDSANTFPFNGQLNFEGQDIEIKFDEYIVLDKPSENIIITPQPKVKPTISSKNKKLKIHFNEILDENTTYTLSFNNAIKDLSEKNDSIFQVVFSTGSYIDSLSIFGIVTDGFTNAPLENFVVALYDKTTSTSFDSIPFNDRPIYINQTNKAGEFKMEYLKAGSYYIFAIEDKNKNLKLDPSERRAFILSETIEVAQINPPIELMAFAQNIVDCKLIRSEFTFPGKVKFVFNSAPEKFEVTSSNFLLKEDTKSVDSLEFWLAASPMAKTQFFINLNDELDTLKPIYKKVPETNAPVDLSYTSNLSNGKLLPNDSLTFYFSEPIQVFDLSKFHFLNKDSSEQIKPTATIINLRTLKFGPISSNVEEVVIDSGAVNSIYNHVNLTDKSTPISFLTPDYFGTLILTMDSVMEASVLVELLDDKNVVIRKVEFNEKMIFTELIPGKYQIRLIFDWDQNGEWTSGSLTDKRLPERVIYNKELVDVKSKWEKEVEWYLEKKEDGNN